MPWLPLASLPTPVQRLYVEGEPVGWVKRDDLSGDPYGGNKVRKLEFVLAAARAAGAERLLTVGAAGSHHALATALYGSRLGFDVTLVLFPQPLTTHVRDVLLLDSALGAELRWAPRMEAVPAALLLARLAHRRQRCYFVPAGGSDAAGTLGYVSAALELAEQVEAGDLPRPDAVHLAAGTMGTTAGLALGFALARLPTTIRAIRIASSILTNERTLARLVRRTSALLAAGGVAPPPMAEVMGRVELCHSAIGAGYGRPTPEGEAAAERLAASGLLLDSTYTAKAAAAMLEALGEGGGNHLFWHTLSAREPEAPGADLPPRFARYVGALAD